MSRWYWLLATLAMNAQAETLKVPSYLNLSPKSGDIMNSILNGGCKSITDTKMICTFNQITLSQHINSQDEIENKLSRIDAELLEVESLEKLNASVPPLAG